MQEEVVMARVELREILTEGDRRAVLGLRRGPGQDAYLDSMEESSSRPSLRPGRCRASGLSTLGMADAWSASR